MLLLPFGDPALWPPRCSRGGRQSPYVLEHNMANYGTSHPHTEEGRTKQDKETSLSLHDMNMWIVGKKPLFIGVSELEVGEAGLQMALFLAI